MGDRLPTRQEILDNQSKIYINDGDQWVPVGTPENKDWVQIGSSGTWGRSYIDTAGHYPTWDFTTGTVWRKYLVTVGNNFFVNRYELGSNTWSWIQQYECAISVGKRLTLREEILNNEGICRFIRLEKYGI